MSTTPDGYLLKREAYPVLADALGESPFTVIAVHQLCRERGQVFLIGTPERFDAAIIESPEKGELLAYGQDVHALYELLRGIADWDGIVVAPDHAPILGQLIEQQMGLQVRYCKVVCHALRNSVLPWYSSVVRQLTLHDLPLLERAEELRWTGFESLEALLRDGLVAAALVEEQLVAIAHTTARSRAYAEIGVGTLEPWRKRGFSSAAATLVAQRIQEAGQVPVWTTDEDNFASLRVAEKLGFTKVGFLTSVIPL